MKTIFTTLLAILLLLGTISASGGGATNAQKDKTRKALKREILHHFHFPDLGENTCEEIAFVEFRITESGSVELAGINATNEKVRTFIAENVTEMRVDPADAIVGETFVFKLCFRFVAM